MPRYIARPTRTADISEGERDHIRQRFGYNVDAPIFRPIEPRPTTWPPKRTLTNSLPEAITLNDAGLGNSPCYFPILNPNLRPNARLLVFSRSRGTWRPAAFRKHAAKTTNRLFTVRFDMPGGSALMDAPRARCRKYEAQLSGQKATRDA